VSSAPFIKAEDSDALEDFSFLLSSCKNSLEAIGYLNKIENPSSMKNIIEKLPFKLQERWRDAADRIINVQGREVTIEDISNFVEERARAVNNPIFGRIQYSTKDKNDHKVKTTTQKSSAPQWYKTAIQFRYARRCARKKMK
jgi:hypothetical protein